MTTAISVKDVYKKFGNLEVLRGINLDIKEGELVCLLGPSGCGKSTLLRLIAGLDTATRGQIILNGKDATHVPASKRNFGIVFQSYALFPNLSAFDNVAYGLKNKKYTRAQVRQTVDHLFDMINLSEAKYRFPAQLSGGEQQRVALARALAMNPDFLLLDEPLSALDAKVRLKLRRQICQIQRELNLTTIMVTHDQDEALTMADRIIVMNKAEVIQTGTPQNIYEHPSTMFVADFIGSINFIRWKGEESMTAVRPENISISQDFDEDAFQAIINHIEFRGAFCRIAVVMQHLGEETELLIDLPLDEIQMANFKEGQSIYVKLPKERLLQFAG